MREHQVNVFLSAYLGFLFPDLIRQLPVVLKIRWFLSSSFTPQSIFLWEIMGLATPFLTFLHPFMGPANQGSGSSKQVVVSSRGKEMGFKWWGLTLEDSCREKTHRREPPLLVSLAPPLLWLCFIRTLLVTHSPLREILKHSRSHLEVATSTAGAADRSVSTEM